jgi:hypothetical protein
MVSAPEGVVSAPEGVVSAPERVGRAPERVVSGVRAVPVGQWMPPGRGLGFHVGRRVRPGAAAWPELGKSGLPGAAGRGQDADLAPGRCTQVTTTIKIA